MLAGCEQFRNHADGIVFAAKEIKISSRSDLENQGFVESSGGSILLDAKNDFINNQVILGVSSIDIHAENFNNTGHIGSKGNIHLSISDKIENAENILSGGKLTLKAKNLTNGSIVK